VIDPQTFKRLDVLSAVQKELATGNRLMPRRADLLTLARNADAVVAWLGPRLRKGIGGGTADVLRADKGWRGSRPLHSLTLEDRVLYRALVEAIQSSLPDALQARQPVEQFRRIPLEVEGVHYVTKTDVTAYYEYVDHDLLIDELVAQTGEEPLVVALGDLLYRIMGRKIGLPQVSRMSDVLGDTYIDIARRRMLRRGFTTFTYSDDFRIATTSLGSARTALEACAEEVRRLGLVLNERKTYTYSKDHYEESLTVFRDAELRLFDGPDAFLLDKYVDDEAALAEAENLLLSNEPIGGEVEEADMILEADHDESRPEAPETAQVVAAQRAWQLWAEEDETEEAQSRIDAAITQSLLGAALPVLGAAGDDSALTALEPLMRYESALTPQTCGYLIAYARHSRTNKVQVRDALDRVVGADLLSGWQSVWLAYTAGALRGSRASRAHVSWLQEAVESDAGAMAAYAALSLARLGHGDPAEIAEAMDRVSPSWRGLTFLALCQVDPALAAAVADNELDRLLLISETSE
jgi:Reverse transcriptase (RNA-dependent DNA polymerase)